MKMWVAITALAANLLAADKQVVTITGEVSYVNFRRGAKGETTVSLTLVEPETRREVTVHAKAAAVPGVRVGDTITVTGRFAATRVIGELKVD